MENIIELVKINEALTLENEQLKFQLRDKSNGQAEVNKKLTTESNGPTGEAEETATTLIKTIANLCGAEYEDEIYLIETVTKTLNDYHTSQINKKVLQINTKERAHLFFDDEVNKAFHFINEKPLRKLRNSICEMMKNYRKNCLMQLTK